MQQSAVSWDIQLRLHGHIGELARLASAVESFCQDRALGTEIEFDLNLALEELFTNAIRHGECLGKSDAVEVRLRSEPTGIVAEFRDAGSAFDPLQVDSPPDLDAPLDQRRTGGLGLHLVRGVMRDLRYRRIGEWNSVRMRRPWGEGEAP